LGCVVYIIRYFIKNRQDLDLVFGLNPLILLGLGGLIVLAFLIYALRFAIILKKCSGRKVPFYFWFKIVILGRYLNLITPQAGNIYRGVMLKKNYQITYTRYLSSFFSFTWIDTCLNLLLALAVICFVQPEMEIGGLRVWVLIGVLGILVAVVPIGLEALFKRVKFQNRYAGWIHGKLSELLRVSVGSARDVRYMTKFVLTGVIAFAISIAAFYLCFLSIEVKVSLPGLALFYVVLKLSNQVIITPGNLGVREIVYGVMSEMMQIGMGQGILISVIMRIISTLVVIVLGTLFGGIGLFQKAGADLKTTNMEQPGTTGR